ncbi:MAG: Alw26I/Eco31I/Esp3I family type II restriction adenine-specific DNA-methyltransferase [Pygmaiobacter sp.]|nr:Alw26I/Eco31I/Esp3I family type II restriction adenine-specific DNA-methyltransferase [Pygmaiobacter sp.]
MDINADNDSALWHKISQDSTNFEQSMDASHRKQTGSYYTALELTLTMMQKLVDSLDEQERKTLYTKTFFEPCVGTGNFVFAYLCTCKNLVFTQEEYCQLINNIYVCDINKDALAVYKTNLKRYVFDVFGISLSEEYFNIHIGAGLLFDLDAKEVAYQSVNEVFPSHVVKNGFDIVVTNPPYKNLKAEKSHYQSPDQYALDKSKYDTIGKIACNHFLYALTGTLNLYKLFIEEITERYVAPDGICSLLIPASILSDKTCSKLRTRIIDTCAIKSLRIISENSSYVDASQALCAMLFHKGKKTSSLFIDGSFNGNVDGGTTMRIDDIVDSDTGNAILVLSKNAYAVRKKMKRFPTIKKLSYIDNLRGELDLTLNKDHITSASTPYKLLRGRHIGYYRLIDIPGIEYVDSEFVQNSAKRKYILKPRLICQQIVNMAKKRRISFAPVPSNVVLGNSCNFISLHENNDGVDFFFLLGILNSSLIDWYFKLTSSNNHINNYEIDNFPIPVNATNKKEISENVQNYLVSKDDSVLQIIDALVYEAYGIVLDTQSVETLHNNEIQEKHRASVSPTELLRRDLSYIIPTVTLEDCSAMISGQASVREICFQKKPDADKFEKRVADEIEKKYRKISQGIILNHTTFKLSDLDLEMIRSVPQGGSWKDIPTETVKKSKRLERITQTGGRTTLYGRVDYSKPSYTITTYFSRPGNGTYVHPIHQRVLSVREAARFQCFPDNYAFCGNKTDMLKQVGNAVPVLLAYSIGKAIREKTDCCTSIDLFSGAGGMTYGLKLAGINASIASDIMESACVTLKANSPEIPVFCGDITEEATKQRIIEAGKRANADIICGGPPCQGFSMAGWRMKDDPRNQLFRHFVDIVASVYPKVIVFENVEGILSYEGGKTYRDIIQLFSELGYHTEGRKLLANHYGVPQRRKRVIILCTRKDIGVLPKDIYPAPLTPNDDRQVSAYETIYDLENVECSDNARYTSMYTSPILQFFRGTIDADEYIKKIRDERGMLSNESDNISDDDKDACASDSFSEIKSQSNQQKFEQLTLF